MGGERDFDKALPVAIPCRPCAGHVPLVAVTQMALQPLFVFFHTAAGIELQRKRVMVQGCGGAGLADHGGDGFMQSGAGLVRHIQCIRQRKRLLQHVSREFSFHALRGFSLIRQFLSNNGLNVAAAQRLWQHPAMLERVRGNLQATGKITGIDTPEHQKHQHVMALHKKWRQTYFSTPSSLTHSAYPFWSGALYNRGRSKTDRVDIDLTHSALAAGLLCADGQFRQIVTVEDAVRGGCNLFDLDQLRLEYSPDEYQNLLMCEFIDDLASVFPLSDLQACMVDSWEVWEDFHALALRPYGRGEVWIGYDPAKGTQNGDSAGCVVIAPPSVPGGKFRILERHQWRGMDFRAQAEAIRQLTLQYNVTYIGIDSTGVGHGVYENVKGFFPAVREFVYNPNVKNALVLKAYDIISHHRIEFDAGHTDIAQSFMAIRRATTASGNRPTYEASRSEEASHADLAWATMHALFNEPLQGEAANTSNIVEIF